MDSNKLLLAASGGDTVKLFDISVEPRDPCILIYAPSLGFRINSVKWNHNNLVVASTGEDKKISLWRKNGHSLGTVPVKTDIDETIEPQELISTISFSNKGSRYLCSGGSSQVVRIWDLQKKRCVKWLRGHTDTITGAMYNCKDEHIASVSRKGDLILHNLASGIKAAELRDPNGQVLGALDYSQMSRHLLVTAGDDGSIHLWDTTGRNPKVCSVTK
ncbi:NEDD1 isoform X1 [Olea europaea subsp. europaea]|uniref:NEDD1 isoform X1 n=1 Tax=Olea europaea subsp. europaea TaxID=158383 RepID=A0A8S0RLJ7_OLEEU|nr:NEDD1 isoform X1 [Olea europaea subsp. europaea]